MQDSLAMKFYLVVTFLLAFCAGSAIGQNCCQKLQIPAKCHFLCGTKEESWWSLTRWTCTHNHGGAVANCKISSTIDYVKAFGDKFTNTVQKSFSKLSAALQAKLSDASKFASATVNELRGVSQDVLSSLSTLAQMTSDQFRGLAGRFTSFTTENLRNLMSKVKIDVIFQNIQELATKTWDLAQSQVIASKAYQKYGKDISKWTSDQLKSLGNLLAGIPSSDLAKVAAGAFDKSLTSLCKVRLKIYQKVSLITPATKAFGKISKWSSAQIKQMCSLIEALTPEQMLELSAKEVSDAIDGLRSLSFSQVQLDALLKKGKDHLGQISSWSLVQLQNIGKMVKGLSAEDLAKIDKNKIKTMLADLGNIKWDTAQARKLGLKLKEAIGLPDTWNSADIDKAKSMLKGLVVSELEKLKDTEVAKSLKNLKNVNWTVDQAQVILEKIKKQSGLNSLGKDDVLAMANTLDAIASSDVGKFTQAVLFAAFPELVLVKVIATPVMRQFIKVYKAQPGNKDISLLGGIAQALTRIELNEATITDIVASLEKLTGNDWDEAQVAELMVKVRTKLGDLNLTEITDSDSPPWGAKNLKKLGKVVLGFTKNELRTFPIRGIEDSLEVMGKQSGWRRGQVVFVLLRFREYLAMQNKSIENLSELDIETLGSLAQGFATKELKALPKSALSVAIKKIGEQTGLPEDKIKAHAFTAVQHFKGITGVDILDTNQIKSLGNLVVGLSKEALSKVSKNAFLSEVYNIAKRPGMTKDKFQELVKLGKKYYGKSDVGQWLTEHWKKLGPAIKGMDAADILRINKDAFDGMIDYLGEMDGWTTEQAKALVLKAKEHWNEKDVSKWTGAQLRRLGSLIKGLNVDEIRRIAQNSFKDMIGTCAHFKDLDGDVLKALATRAKQVLASGDASKFDLAQLKKLGCAVTGLDVADLAKLKLDIDIIAELGKHTGWSTQQLKTLSTKVKTFLAQNVNKENLMSIGNLIKGLSVDDIKALSKDAFKYAAGKIGKIEGLSKEQIKALIGKAKEAWGSDVSTWTLAQINEAGNLLSGLSSSDIRKIKKDAVDQIKPVVLKSMTKEQIKAFTVDQLKSMDSPQVYSLSAEQRSGFTSAQLRAAVSAEQQDPQDPDPWACKGTCSGAGTFESTNLIYAFILTSVVFFLLRG